MPDNWYELSKECVAKIRSDFKDKGVTQVVNADQTFINFHPTSDDGRIICPTGSKRVGTTVQSDEKLGATLMVTVTAEGKILKPWWVFTGQKCLCVSEAEHDRRKGLPAHLDGQFF